MKTKFRIFWVYISTVTVLLGAGASPFAQNDRQYDYPQCLISLKNASHLITSQHLLLERNAAGVVTGASGGQDDLLYEFCRSYLAVIYAQKTLSTSELNQQAGGLKINSADANAESLKVELRIANDLIHKLGLSDAEMKDICHWSKSPVGKSQSR
jgi:hypothetical protein